VRVGRVVSGRLFWWSVKSSHNPPPHGPSFGSCAQSRWPVNKKYHQRFLTGSYQVTIRQSIAISTPARRDESQDRHVFPQPKNHTPDSWDPLSPPCGVQQAFNRGRPVTVLRVSPLGASPRSVGQVVMLPERPRVHIARRTWRRPNVTRPMSATGMGTAGRVRTRSRRS